MKPLVTVSDIVGLLEEMVPTNLAEDWDNVGLMLGKRNQPVKRVLLALDITGETVQQAIDYKADMIITHHPLIFKGLKCITDNDWQQKLILKLAEHSIAVFSAHTNLDIVSGGVNDVLVKRFHLHNDDVLDVATGLGRIGIIETCSLGEFARFVKKKLRADYIIVGDAGKKVHRVAVCGGAGSDLIDIALKKGADTFVTGDIKYHSAQQAVFSGLNIIDAGHQSTELPVLEYLADRLSLRFTEKDWPINLKIACENLLLKQF